MPSTPDGITITPSLDDCSSSTNLDRATTITATITHTNDNYSTNSYGDEQHSETGTVVTPVADQHPTTTTTLDNLTNSAASGPDTVTDMAPSATISSASLAYSYPPPPVYPAITPTLHSSPIAILSTPSKGRGVFSTAPIAAGTIIDISPVLLLSNEEYYGLRQGGKEGRGMGVEGSVLRGYVFTWKGKEGGMALALGLGSLFNHSSTPNVSFELNLTSYTISYRAFRPIPPNEELCIFYGHRASFSSDPSTPSPGDDSSDDEGEWGGMDGLEIRDPREDKGGRGRGGGGEGGGKWSKAKWDEDIVPFKELDWVKVTNVIDPEDQELVTLDCYIIDVPSQSAQVAFNFARRHYKDSAPTLGHLKRVRRHPTNPLLISVLLFPISAAPPNLPSLLAEPPMADLNPVLYPHKVSALVARTEQQGKEWGDLWPVQMVHIREGPKALPRAKGWEKIKMGWIRREASRVWKSAVEAGRKGEHPIAVTVTDSFSPDVHSPSTSLPARWVESHDTRQSTGNILCHAVSNAIDAMASLDRLGRRPSTAYLLTGLTVFTSHEPCLLCSMALLHSRIQTLFYVRPSEGSGGCGSVYGVHEDGGLNHRFEVWRWRGPEFREKIGEVRLDP